MTISRNTVHHVLEGVCDNITEYSTSCVRGCVTISRNIVHNVLEGVCDNITYIYSTSCVRGCM